MTATRVGIIGGGICGPVMAMLLKLKGYDPIIYERWPNLKDRGLGIG
jgi:salicylate hydroxylase